jgi:hypothetical protein
MSSQSPSPLQTVNRAAIIQSPDTGLPRPSENIFSISGPPFHPAFFLGGEERIRLLDGQVRGMAFGLSS